MLPVNFFLSMIPRIRPGYKCSVILQRHIMENEYQLGARPHRLSLICHPGTLISKSILRPQATHIYERTAWYCKVHTLPHKIDRYQAVHCDVGDIPEFVTAQDFDVVLKASLEDWRSTKKSAVWLQVPIARGDVIPVAGKYGFEFHHAEYDTAVLCLWLKEDVPKKLPQYATHQVGVSGVVIREDTNQVLVVRDRNRPFTLWKFPGGLAELGEDINKTAEREILEETGVKTECQGVLAFRQQHNHPNSFGRSDLFFVCRMIPLTTKIIQCEDEIEACEWMDIGKLEECGRTSAITQRIIKLIRIGQKRGYEHVDLKASEFQSVYKGISFKIYNRLLPSPAEEHTDYLHSIAYPEELYNIIEIDKT